jgi:predicted MFS family arabinose efflux permease
MRIYYGWYIVAISVVSLTLLLGSTFHAFGVFVLPVSQDFGLTRAQTNTALILFSLGSAICAPIVGQMLDRLSIRSIMLGCALLMGASLVALSRSHSVWLCAIVLGVPLAFATQGAGVLTATTLVARWFSVHRGRAMAIALTGMSLGGILLTPLIAVLVEHLGWRPTLAIVGCAVALTLVALVPVAREKPGPDDVESQTARADDAESAGDQAASSAQPLSAISLLRMWQFWTIGLSAALTLGGTQAVMITFVPLAQGSGIGMTQAASLISVLSAAGLVGNLLLAWIADRVDRIQLLGSLFIVVALVNGLLYFSHSFPLFVTCAALLGFTGGLVSPAFYALIADRFGPASFGTTNGLMTPVLTLVGALCVRYAGEVFDRTGGYSFLFLSFIASQAFAALLMFGTGMLAAPPAGAQVLRGAPAVH